MFVLSLKILSKGEWVERHIHVFTDNRCKGDYDHFYNGEALFLSLGANESSVELAQLLVSKFQGAYVANDSEGEDDWVIYGRPADFNLSALINEETDNPVS